MASLINLLLLTEVVGITSEESQEKTKTNGADLGIATAWIHGCLLILFASGCIEW